MPPAVVDAERDASIAAGKAASWPGMRKGGRGEVFSLEYRIKILLKSDFPDAAAAKRVEIEQ
jgi:hypothetical protein